MHRELHPGWGTLVLSHTKTGISDHHKALGICQRTQAILRTQTTPQAFNKIERGEKTLWLLVNADLSSLTLNAEGLALVLLSTCGVQALVSSCLESD